MAYFTYDARVPTDEFVPRKNTQEELDAMLIPMDKRDSCADNYVEFKKCIMVVHQTKSVTTWRKTTKDHCGYYFDHWNYCREKRMAQLGLSPRTFNA
jgi:IMP cyclohydrolase